MILRILLLGLIVAILAMTTVELLTSMIDAGFNRAIDVTRTR
jgi:hypothetical protein